MSEAKEKPILFNGEMVRAILAGRKTQTRRAISFKNATSLTDDTCSVSRLYEWADRQWVEIENKTAMWNIKCPYGKIGDVLWVRENFSARTAHTCGESGCDCGDFYIEYAAGGEPNLFSDCDERVGEWCFYQNKNYPSIHMPKFASRLHLKIKSIRVERLQDISEEDAKAEGARFTDFGLSNPRGEMSIDGGKTFNKMKPQQNPGWHVVDVTSPDQCLQSAKNAFGNLWNHINGPESWQQNPWVWVVEFEVIK